MVAAEDSRELDHLKSKLCGYWIVLSLNDLQRAVIEITDIVTKSENNGYVRLSPQFQLSLVENISADDGATYILKISDLKNGLTRATAA